MFKISWLYNFGKTFWCILIYCLLLYYLSIILLRLEYFNYFMVAALKMPLISFAIFKILHFSFKYLYGRNPENTSWTYNKAPVQDVMFSILFWLLGVGMVVILIAPQFPD